MKLVHSSRMLKTALTVDAVAGAGTAALQLLLPGLLAEQLGLPRGLLLETGLFLIGFVALLSFLARSERVPAALVRTIVIGNIAWSAGCVLLWAAGLVTPTPLGIAFLLLQAAVVLTLAGWEAAGLRASRPVTSAGIAAAH
jgi:hypothetical protein